MYKNFIAIVIRLRQTPGRPVYAAGTYLLGFLVNPLAEPDARSASILVDELDAGGFENTFYVGKRFRVTGVSTYFQIGDRIAMQAGCVGEISHRPS
jgi:hypothetical protein